LHEVARSVGCELTKWPVRLDGDHWSLDLDELRRAIRPSTRLLIINFPHNPTGLLPSCDTLDAILQIADQHGLYVFSDEMYRWLEYDASQCLPPLCAIYDRGISLSGLSKSMALPGLRIGWLAARDRRLMLKWMTYKDYTTICSSAPSEVLALMALRAKDTIVRRNLDIISANLRYADEFFSDYAALFSWQRPRAGSVAFPRWTGAVAVEDFCRRVLDEHGVMIVPGSLFDVPGGFFRLGLGRANFTQAMDLVRSYLGRHRR
jgi:aspartate/methionine/tyrosine aminotransferase